MRHIRGFFFVALLVLVFGGGTAYGSTEDLTKDSASGISYGRVKCSECGFEFKGPDKEPVEDLTKEGVSGISYGRVKCPECGFAFKAPDKSSVEDLTEDKASAISYGRVKCTRCGFDFSVNN